MRIGTFASEFESGRDWGANLVDFIKGIDCLIIGCDSSRLVGGGVLREINVARKAGKLIIIFKLDDDQLRRYWGYESAGPRHNPIVRLKKREEALAGRRQLDRRESGSRETG